MSDLGEKEPMSAKTGKYPTINLENIMNSYAVRATELSEKSGVSRETIYRYLKGQVRPRIGSVGLIAKALTEIIGKKITVDDLLENLSEKELEKLK